MGGYFFWFKEIFMWGCEGGYGDFKYFGLGGVFMVYEIVIVGYLSSEVIC